MRCRTQEKNILEKKYKNLTITVFLKGRVKNT